MWKNLKNPIFSKNEGNFMVFSLNYRPHLAFSIRTWAQLTKRIQQDNFGVTTKILFGECHIKYYKQKVGKKKAGEKRTRKQANLTLYNFEYKTTK